jgi:hypothetical protein
MAKRIYLVLVMAVVVAGVVFADSKLVKKYTTYQTSLNNLDISRVFYNDAILYLSRAQYYLCNYVIFNDKDKQNYAWTLEVCQYDYSWGTVFSIEFMVSNGYFILKTSNNSFTAGETSSDGIVTFRSGTVGRNSICSRIAENFTAFQNESSTVLKMYEDNYGLASKEAFAYVLFSLAMN